jgi:hypothetical protein
MFCGGVDAVEVFNSSIVAGVFGVLQQHLGVADDGV